MYWVSVSGQDANNNVRFTSAAYLVMGLRRTLYDVGLFKPHYQLYDCAEHMTGCVFAGVFAM